MKNFFASILLSFFVTQCFACICWFSTDKDGLEKRIKEADVILYATAMPAYNLFNDLQRGDYAGITEVIFWVEYVWKGKNVKTIKLKGKRYPCWDASYRIGERYIIFGHINKETGELETNNCNSLSEETIPDPWHKIKRELSDSEVAEYRKAVKAEFESVKRLINRQTGR